MMRPVLPLVAAAGLALALGLWCNQHPQSSTETVFQPPSRLSEPAPVCPWREPEADLGQFFPEATRSQAVTLILSGRRLELQQRLGRMPSGEENSLVVHRIFSQEQCVGSVLTRRVKGDHGVIEIVLAVGPDQRVRGLKLQRLREPGPIADALTNPAWLHAFTGKGMEADWRVGGDLPHLPSAALPCAIDLCAGVRSSLILLAVAENTGQPGTHH